MTNRDWYICEGMLSVFMMQGSKHTARIVWRNDYSEQSDQFGSHDLQRLEGANFNRKPFMLPVGSSKSYYIEKSVTTQGEPHSQHAISQPMTSNNSPPRGSRGQQIRYGSLGTSSSRTGSLNGHDIKFGSQRQDYDY